MNEPETQAAWRLFCFNWLLLGAMVATLVLGVTTTSFSIGLFGLFVGAGITGAYIGYAYYKRYRAKERDPRVIFTLGSTGQILLIPALMTPVTYFAAAANLPMQDMALHAADRALGLDWMAYYNFIYDHHALLVAAVWTYSMIGWPVFGVPIVLGWTGRYRRLQTFTLAFGIALVITTAVFAFVPAMGTYHLFKFLPDPEVFTPGGYIDQVRDLPLVRDGSLRHLSLIELAGIIAFPSFHAAAAVIFLWALWPVRWIGPVALTLNLLMLLATPVVGGHYFVDVFAGIAVAAVSIAAAAWITSRLTRTAPGPVYAASLGQPAE
jgi:hypothetical protein